jgi:hypothetical protein
MQGAGKGTSFLSLLPASTIPHPHRSAAMISQETHLTYRIRVGHYEVCVKARDEDEAVALARRQMARELPRLYDVICTLTTARFQVEPAT